MITTKNVVDVVFCLDASGSMVPCIDGVRKNLNAFLDGLKGDANHRFDCRLDFLTLRCSQTFDAFQFETLRKRSWAECIEALYLTPAGKARGEEPGPPNGSPGDPRGSKARLPFRGNKSGTDANLPPFFTTDPKEIRRGLEHIATYGDEAMLVALDLCLDFPWRPRGRCHRVVVMFTDEPLEDNAGWPQQQAKLDAIIDKVQKLGVKLYIVGPVSPGLETLAEADKCLYQRVTQTRDGLGALDFAKVLGQIGQSVSGSVIRDRPEAPVPRALFGQDRLVEGAAEIKGGE